MVRVAVFGANGRMGAEVCRAVEAADDLELVAAVDAGDPRDEVEAKAQVVVDFTTPDVVQNAILQAEIGNGTPLFYFIRPSHLHLSDLIMQGLYASTSASPLQERYDSCVPYLLGEGQAMHYAFVPRAFPAPHRRLRIPLRPGPDYLRDALTRTLSAHEVIFDLQVQLQTDARTMPLEHAGVTWSSRTSPPVTVATLRLPAQDLAAVEQRQLADRLRFNPWHAMPEHRPLGNQNRARRTIYASLADVRQSMNGTRPWEPTEEDWAQTLRDAA